MSHRQADRHQFPYRHKSQLPQGTGLGRPILLRSDALFSLDNGKHHWHLHLSLLDIILYPTCIHPLIGVLFALTIPATTCPVLSPLYSFFFFYLYLHLCLSPPTWLCLFNTWQYVFHVCPRRCISVTSGAGSQWLILSSGGCLAHWEESSQNRRWAPITGLPDQGSPPTLSEYTHVHTAKHAHMSWQIGKNACTCMHAHTKDFTHKHCHSNTLSLLIYPRWLSLHLAPPLYFFICLLYYSSSSLSLSSLIPRSVRLLFTLGFPDMISMKTCSSSHALPVLPSTLIV